MNALASLPSLRTVLLGAAVAAALLGAALTMPARPAAGIGEPAEIVLKDGTVVRGTILQELEGRVKIETENNEVRSIDRADIVEIRLAPNMESRVVEILAGIDRLLDGQADILERLPRPGASSDARQNGAAAPAREPAGPAAGVAAAPGPEKIRAALGEPESIARDCFIGTPAAGPNPFASEKWIYAPGAGGLRSDERRAVFVVNGVVVGSIVEGPAGVLRPDSGLSRLLSPR